MDQIHPPAGFAVSTRHGRSKTRKLNWSALSSILTGPSLSKRGPNAAIEPVVTVGTSATLVHATVEKNPFNGTWRAAFALRPDGSGVPVELRAYLRKPPQR